MPLSDVVLYLVLDNSTSMLQPDPSTNRASVSTRLEAQDRVALYSYQQSLQKAGYGFSRIGEDEVLSTQQFRDAVINNSSQSLASVLDDFEVVVKDEQFGARDVTVHLINYGYVVEHTKSSFTAKQSTKATSIAQRILDVQTPDQIYGNSIKGNRLWNKRNLLDPTEKDLFQGDDRPSSNLYAGTEMLAALTGLEHLLTQQADDNNRGRYTYITMMTDGRPERRSWWDTRRGAGSDSVTGQSVPLPQSLGGDPITSSGLIYDASGQPTFLNDNSGDKPWKIMQRRLNAALDQIDRQSASRLDGVEVEVVATGDGTDADFPTIYDNLFRDQTFNPENGGWSYSLQTSYGLPEFSG